MVIIKQALKSTSANPFFRMNAIFFIGSMSVAFLNYLYYPVLGRLLPTETFGELQVIVSAFMQMTIILNVLSMIAVSILINQKSTHRARKTVAELEKVSIYMGIGALVIVAATAELLRQALKFDSATPFVAIMVVFIITIPFTFRNAQLKAHADFTGTSLANAIGAGTKLILSVILVYCALETFGAVLGILGAQIIALVYSNARAQRYGYDKVYLPRLTKPDMSLLRPYLPYAAFVLCLSLITTLQVSMDIAIIKYLFSPEEAGNYSAVATISRIIFFALSSIIGVLLSSVNVNEPHSTHWRVFLRSLLLAISVGGFVTLVFCLFPTHIMHMLMGSRYDVLTHLLPIISLATFAASLVALQTTYHISLYHYRAIIPVVLGFVVTLGLVFARHDTIDLIATNIFIGSTLMLVFVSFFTAYTHRSSLR